MIHNKGVLRSDLEEGRQKYANWIFSFVLVAAFYVITKICILKTIFLNLLQHILKLHFWDSNEEPDDVSVMIEVMRLETTNDIYFADVISQRCQ